MTIKVDPDRHYTVTHGAEALLIHEISTGAHWNGWHGDARPGVGITRPGEIITSNPDARLIFRRDKQDRVVAVLSAEVPDGEGVDPNDQRAVVEAFCALTGEPVDVYLPADVARNEAQEN